jgi:hypothetical protein
MITPFFQGTCEFPSAAAGLLWRSERLNGPAKVVRNMPDALLLATLDFEQMSG